MLWIVLGFVGFAITFLTGLFWIKPQSERMKKMIEQDGGMSPPAYAAARRMIVFSRLDYAVLYLVVADMVVQADQGRHVDARRSSLSSSSLGTRSSSAARGRSRARSA